MAVDDALAGCTVLLGVFFFLLLHVSSHVTEGEGVEGGVGNMRRCMVTEWGGL